MNCSECGEPLADDQTFLGDQTRLLCAICWMIEYFDIPAARVWVEVDHSDVCASASKRADRDAPADDRPHFGDARVMMARIHVRAEMVGGRPRSWRIEETTVVDNDQFEATVRTRAYALFEYVLRLKLQQVREMRLSPGDDVVFDIEVR